MSKPSLPQATKLPSNSDVNEEDESMGLNFAYELLENPNNIDEDQELIDIMGDILVDVLESEMGEINEGQFLSEE